MVEWRREEWRGEGVGMSGLLQVGQQV